MPGAVAPSLHATVHHYLKSIQSRHEVKFHCSQNVIEKNFRLYGNPSSERSTLHTLWTLDSRSIVTQLQNQNRRQKIFNMGDLRLCRGVNIPNLTNSTDLQCFSPYFNLTGLYGISAKSESSQPWVSESISSPQTAKPGERYTPLVTALLASLPFSHHFRYWTKRLHTFFHDRILLKILFYNLGAASPSLSIKLTTVTTILEYCKTHGTRFPSIAAVILTPHPPITAQRFDA